MNFLRHLSVAAFLLTSLAAAQQLAPTYIQIDPARSQAGQTSLTNLGQKPQSYAVRAVKWTVENGQSVLTDTRDVVLSPAAFTLVPGASQVIRIGIRKRAEGTELTYRVLIEEQPSADTPASQQAGANGVVLNIQRLTTYSVPVYVTPASSAPKLSYSLAVDGSDLILSAQNSGTRSQLMNNPQLTAGTQKTSLTSAAVLAGSVQSWRVPGWASVTGPLKFSFTDRTGKPFEADLAR